MIYTIGGIKGGSGKTTIALSLSVMLSKQGRKILLVDADKQVTATDFSKWRTETLGDTGFTSIQLLEMQVRNEVLKLKSDYDDIIIDAGGRDTASQRAALAVSDILLAPFAPKSFDIWTLDQVENLVQEMQLANPNLQAFVVLNKLDYNENDRIQGKELIEESGTFKVLNNFLRERKAFSNAASMGLSVSEYKPKNKKAIAELEKLIAEIISLGKNKSSNK